MLFVLTRLFKPGATDIEAKVVAGFLVATEALAAHF